MASKKKAVKKKKKKQLASDQEPVARSGILAGGNFIVDHVKIVDHYQEHEMLESILSESMSNGGGPYNVLKDLARLGDVVLIVVALVVRLTERSSRD